MADGVVQNVAAPILSVIALDSPPEGRMLAPFAVTLTPIAPISNQAYQLRTGNSLSQVRTLLVDNSANAFPVLITHGVGNLRTLVPAAGGALLATASNQGAYFFTLDSSGILSDVVVNVSLFNYEIPPALWGTQVITVTTPNLPIGSAILWTGSAAAIPAGFVLCDGSIVTRSDGLGTITAPDLRGKFVIGAGGAYAPGANGGSSKILQANLPALNFPVTDPGHNHSYTGAIASIAGSGPFPSAQAGSSTNTGTATTGITVSSGGSGADFLPPYYAECWIMKF